MNESTQIAKALRLTIAEFGLSQTAIAGWSGLNPNDISKFARGKRIPRGDTLIKVINTLPGDAKHYCIDLLFNQGAPMKQSPLSEFIAKWQSHEGVSQTELEILIQQRTMLPIRALHEIQSGRYANETELGFLGAVILKPNKEFYILDELVAIQDGIIKPYQNGDASNVKSET